MQQKQAIQTRFLKAFNFKPHTFKLKSSIFSSLIFATLINNAYALEANAEIRSELNSQESVAVTIYNSDLALVKDQRKVKLNSGINQLAIRDVSAIIRPETALLRSISHAGSFTTLEQNFDFDLLTPQKLLEKYVGKDINIVKTNPKTGVETTESATILSANDGVIVKIGNRIETGINGRIVYNNVPANLRDRPTLVTQISNKVAGEQSIELSYLTGGLNWKADYVAELNAAENAIDLSGWVTLTNTSGTSYNKAKLQLVAGDVNRVQPTMLRESKAVRMQAMATAEAPMAEESLLEYHLYSLDKATDIKDNQTKQVALLSANKIPARKELVLSGANHYYQYRAGDLGQKIKVGVFVEFDNKQSSQLGMPLPKGIMRMYKKDSQGNAQFVGEDQIDHTPKNETVRLKLGEAFDVTADKKQTDFKTLAAPDKSVQAYETAYEIVLKNAKKESVTVSVQEPIPADWKILNESHPSKKANSQLAVWQIVVPAMSSTTLTYRTLVKY